MKVAITFPGCHKRAGVERVVLESANFLAGRGHAVRLYACDIDEASLNPSVEKVRISLPFSQIAPAAGLFDRTISRRLEADRPDVLCSFGTVCPTGGVFWVPSVHQAWLEISQRTRGLSGRLKQRCNPLHPLLIHREKQHFMKRRYKALIALTPQVSNDLQRLYNIPSSDITVLGNGFSTNDFNLKQTLKYRDAMRNALGYAETDLVIIFVANELERKGFFALTSALSRLNDRRLKLLVVGAVNPQTVHNTAAELGISANVRCIGASGHIAQYYAAADIFALPTKYEAWGLVIIEAMACGLPVVTSRLAGASEAVEEGVSGLLLDNPLDVAEVEQKLRAALFEIVPDRDRISQSVQKYTWDKVLTKYEDILLSTMRLTPHNKAVQRYSTQVATGK